MAVPASEGHPRGATLLETLEARLQAAAEATKQHGNRQLHQTAMRMRNFPDWGRRSIRLSLCMLIFGCIGHTNHSRLALEIKQATNWAAVTCVVVSAPLMGQVAEVSVYRVVGTIIGGLTGYAVYTLGTFLFDADDPNGLGDYRAGLMVVAFAPLMITPTTYLAYKHSADQLTKFVQLTYVVVGFAASMTGKSATLLATLRVSGIIMGALLSLLLAVLVLPRSATVESCRELKKSIKALADLNQAVWAASQNPLPTETKVKKRTGVMARLAGLAAVGNLFSSAAVRTPGSITAATPPGVKSSSSALALQSLLNSADDTKKEGEAEKLFTAVYAGLSRVEGMLEQCKGEVFIHHLYGHYLFLPLFWPSQLYGLKFKRKPRGRWQLPIEDMTAVITVLRRIARLLWTLLLDFEDGFDETMAEVLAQYYPKALMSELVLYTHKSLMDLYAAFPNAQLIEIDNLLNLGQVVECLIHISDTRNRGGFQPRRRRNGTRQHVGSTGAPSSPPLQGTAAAVHDGSPGSANTHGWASPSAAHTTLCWDATTMTFQRAPGSQPTTNSLAQKTSAAGVSPLMFASHTLSGRLGQVSLLELPPRRLMRAAAASGSQDLTRTLSNGSTGADLLSSSLGKKAAVPKRPVSHDLPQQAAFTAKTAANDASEGPMGVWSLGSQRQMLPTIPSQSDLGSPCMPHLRSKATLSPFASAQGLVQASMHIADSQERGVLQVNPAQGQGAWSAGGPASQFYTTKKRASYEESTPLLHGSQISTAATPAQVPNSQLQPPVMSSQGTHTNSHDNLGISMQQYHHHQQQQQQQQDELAENTEELPLLVASVQQGGAQDTRPLQSEWPSGAVQVPLHRFSSGTCSSNLQDRASPATPRASGDGLVHRHSRTTYHRCSSSTAWDAEEPEHKPTTAKVQLNMEAEGTHLQRQSHEQLATKTTSGKRTQGVAPTALAARLESLLASTAVEPITFPPTEEGYVSQVRWHSMQWLLDELVEELEEAFLGLSIIMAKLPHPIKS